MAEGCDLIFDLRHSASVSESFAEIQQRLATAHGKTARTKGSDAERGWLVLDLVQEGAKAKTPERGSPGSHCDRLERAFGLACRGTPLMFEHLLQAFPKVRVG